MGNGPVSSLSVLSYWHAIFISYFSSEEEVL